MPIRVNTLLTTRQGGVKFPLETVMSDEKDYQQQIEAGKTFVRETLAQLATDLKQADINHFSFKITSNDFDNEEVSIFDPKAVRSWPR